MRTEAQRGFLHGFVLTEQELRRIVDLATQQLSKVLPPSEIVYKFALRFRNGAIATTSSIEEVLAQENMGSGAIVRLELTIGRDGPNPLWRIELDFIDADADERASATSVRYKVLGEERDWVFVTSSQLEERIRRIRRFAPNQIFGLRRGASMIVPFALLAFAIVSLFVGGSRERDLQQAVVDSLQALQNSGVQVDPVEALLSLERSRIAVRSASTELLSIYNPFVVLTAILAGVTLIGVFWSVFFPLFNFVWGDYLDHFQRRQNVGRFLLGAVLLGLLIGIASNYVSRWLGL